MKQGYRSIGFVMILCLLYGWALRAQTAPNIEHIAVQGNVVIPASTILAQVETKVGLPYNPNVVTEDVRRVYAIGFFETVNVEMQDGVDGVRLTYVVKERPVISQIEFHGNKAVRDEKLVEVLELSPDKISELANLKFYPMKVREDRERMLSLYHRQGFQYATVTSELIPDPEAPEEKVIVRYHIEENQRMAVRNIRFEGNTVLSAEELQKAILTKKTWLLSFLTGSGKFSEELLEADKQNLREIYRDHGYLDAKVTDVAVDALDDSKYVVITFTIEEGDLYTVAEVGISGNAVFSTETLQEEIKTVVGEPFSPAVIRGDLRAIVDLYSEKGYIQPITEDTTGKLLVEPDVRIVQNSKQLKVLYTIQEGVPHIVNRIVITGNKDTRDKVIRRELTLQEGELIQNEALRKSQQKVFNLGLFEDLSLEILDGDEPYTVDLVLSVKERYSIGSFNFGGGWDTVDAWTVTGGLTAHNLFGLAHTLDFSTTLGSTSTIFNIDYEMPRFLDSPITLGLNAYKLDREYSSYSKQSSGGGIRIGWKIAENTMFFPQYRYELVNIYDVDEDASVRFHESEGESATSSVAFSLRRSTINNVLLPTKGIRTQLRTEVAGGLLGADHDFYKISVNNNIYFPLYKEIALRMKMEYGFIKEYGDSDSVPIFERFYGGGATTIRGYKDRSIGPKDEDEEALGGNSRALFTSEIIIPLQNQIRFLAFFDMGDVYGSDEEFDVSTLKKSIGAGIRLNTPLGLLRFDLGYKLDDAEVSADDKGYAFHFGLGNAF
jgi:outer membrane protein insertion porin family